MGNGARVKTPPNDPMMLNERCCPLGPPRPSNWTLMGCDPADVTALAHCILMLRTEEQPPLQLFSM